MKSLNDPEYRIPGTNIVSFSRWSRENVPKPPPAHKIGDRVLVELLVHKSYEDCDGTPLFAIGGDNIGCSCPSLLHGYNNESLTPADWIAGEAPLENRLRQDLWAWCWQGGEGFPVFVSKEETDWPANASHWKPVVVPDGPEIDR